MDIVRYEGLREKFQTGDLLAFEGRGLVSWLIQWRTHSRYSHVALIVRLTEGADRVFLLHALMLHGVVLIPASRYLAKYHGEVEWVGLKPSVIEAHPGLRQALLTDALLELGKPYDWRGVLRFVLPWVKQQNGAYFCSELSADLRKRHGLGGDVQLSPAQMVEQPENEVPVAL